MRFGILQVVWKPENDSMDTRKNALEKVDSVLLWPFLVSTLVFGSVNDTLKWIFVLDSPTPGPRMQSLVTTRIVIYILLGSTWDQHGQTCFIGPKKANFRQLQMIKCKIEVALNFFFQVVGPGSCACQTKQLINGN